MIKLSRNGMSLSITVLMVLFAGLALADMEVENIIQLGPEAGSGSGPTSLAIDHNHSRLYVGNHGSHNIQVIDLTSNKVIDAIDTERPVYCLMIDEASNRLYAGAEVNRILEIDTNSNTIIRSTKVACSPEQFALDVVNKRLYISHGGCHQNMVSIIDTAEMQLLGTTQVGEYAIGLAIDQPNNRLYVANLRDNTISVVNTATNTMIDTTQVDNPVSLVLNQEKGELYVGHDSGFALSVVNVETGKVIDTIDIGLHSHLLRLYNKKLYVGDIDGRTVSIVNTENDALVDVISLNHGGVRDIEVDPTNQKIYVAHGYVRNSISVISQEDQALEISLGGSPYSFAIDEIEHKLYSANINSGTISVVNLTNNSVMDVIDVHDMPQVLAIDTSSNKLYIGHRDSYPPYRISIVNTSNHSVIDTISVDSTIYSLALDQSEKRLYAGGNATVLVFDTEKDLQIGAIGTPADFGYNKALALDTEKRFLYAVSTSENSILVKIDLRTNFIVESLDISGWARDIAFDSSNGLLYVGCHAGAGFKSVVIVDVETMEILEEIGGSNVLSVDLDKLHNKLYVGTSDGLMIVDLLTKTIEKNINLDFGDGRPVLFSHQRNKLYVGTTHNGTITVMSYSSASSPVPSLANTPWPMFRHDLQHTGRSPYSGPESPELKWSYTTEERVTSSPAIGSDSTIYVGSLDKKLYAITPDGTEKWKYTTGGDIYSTPAIGSDGTIYIGSLDRKLYAINSDGSLKWSYTTGGIVVSSPVIDSDGTIYVSSADKYPNIRDPDGKLYAINPDDGSLKWSYALGDSATSSPAIGSDDTIYIGSRDHKLYAINPDGTEKWKHTTGDSVFSSPAISFDGTVYIGSTDKKLYAINPDGSLKWNYTMGSDVLSSPAIGFDGTIYVGSGDGNLYAVNPDGTERWNYATGRSVTSSPSIGSNGTIYMHSRDKKLYAINSDGTEKWNYTIGDIECSSPVIGSDGTIYVGSGDGKLYAIGANHPPNQPSNISPTDGTTGVSLTPTLQSSAFSDPDKRDIHAASHWQITTTSGDYSRAAFDSGPVTPILTQFTVPAEILNYYTTYYWRVRHQDNHGTWSEYSSETSFTTTGPGPPLADTPWPMFRHDPQHTGRSPYSGPEMPNLKWNYTTGGGINSSPAIGSDGTIYVGSTDHNLYAINPDDSLKWSYTMDLIQCSSPAVDSDGTIYVGSFDGKLHAINPDGTEKWSYNTGSTIESSPTIGSDGTIYVGSGLDLYAINPDGSLKWSYRTEHDIYSSPAIGFDGTIYVGSQDNKLYAINPDGNFKWSYHTGSLIRSSPAIGSDGTIYVGSYDYRLYAINPNGNLKWSYTTGSGIHSSPAIGSDGTIYVGSFDGKLHAINPDGTKKWNYTTAKAIDSSPAVDSDGAIYVGSQDNKLYAINPDGSLRWSYTTGREIQSSPAIGSDGTIYVGSGDRKLYAIGANQSPHQPSNILPADGATVISLVPTLKSSAFSDPDSRDTHAASQWQITTTSGDYSSPVFDSSPVTPILIQFTVPSESLSYYITYYWRVRHQDNHGAWSDYSSETSFTTTALPLADTPWPKLGHDIRNTGQSPYKGPQTAFVKWSYQTGATVRSSPAIGSDGTVYVGSHDGKLYALNPDGTLKWSYQTGNDIYHSSPTIGSDGTIYVGSTDYKLYALNPDGTLKWSYQTGDRIVNSSPAIGLDGTVYVGSAESKLYAISPDGTLKWSYQAGAIDSPAIGLDGTVYVGSTDRKLYALNPDGTLKWSYTTRNYISSSPAISSDGTVYVGSNDWNLYALNPDGTLKWSYEANGEVISPAISSDGTVYVGVWHRDLYAISPDGTLKWNYRTGHYIEASPAIGSDGTVYVGSTDGKLYALNPDGTLKWNYRTGDRISSSPTIGLDGTLYVGSEDGKLYAFGVAPDVSLSATSYHFGNVQINSSSSWTLTVANAGDASLSVDNISSSNAQFEISPTSFIVAMGGSQNVTVTFAPTSAGSHQSAALTITSNDPDEQTVMVSLSGVGMYGTAPATPTDLAASTGDEQVTLTWSLNTESDLSYYKIYRNTTSGFTPISSDFIASVNHPDTTYTDAELANGMTYYYRITAVDTSENESGYSREANATPVPSIQLLVLIPYTPDPTNNTTPNLDWQDMSDASAYHIQIDDNADFSSPIIDDNSLTKSEYTQSSPLPEGEIYWRVSSIDGKGNESDFSNIDDFTIDSTAPSTPVVIDDGDVTTSTTELYASWTSSDAQSGVAEYQYAIGTTPDGVDVVSWTLTGRNTEIAVTDLNLTVGQSYYFGVKSKNGVGLWSKVGVSDGITIQLPSKANLTLEPTSGPVETRVRVTGEEFDPNTDIGKLTTNGVETFVVGVGETTVINGNIWTNEDGTFVVTFLVSKQPGGGVIVAVGDVNTRFVITAQIFVTPESGPAGATIKVEGDGFASEEDINVDFSDTKDIATGKTTTDGSFEVTLEAIATEAGTKEILVTGSLSERTAKANFELLSSEPDFVFSCKEPNQKARPGEPLVYSVEGIGQNGFNLPVELLAKNLPKDVEWEFNPTIASPTVTEPRVKIQFTLRIPETIEQGEYSFTVIGVNLENKFVENLELSFTVEKVESDIFVIVTPKEIRLNETVTISGQVDLQEDDERTGMEIQLTHLFGDETVYEQTVSARGEKREYTHEYVPSKVGDWKVKACWEGDSKYQGACRETFFTVIKGKSILTLSSSPGAPNLGEETLINVKLFPELENEPLDFKITFPDGKTKKEPDIKTGEIGIWQYKIVPTQEGEYKFEAKWAGNSSYEQATEKLVINAQKEPGRAIIVLGGGDETTNPAWLTFNGIAKLVYKTFKRRYPQDKNIDSEYIFFLSPSELPDPTIDGKTSEKWLEYAITEWAKERVSKYVPLYIYLISHNLDDKFLLAKGAEDAYLKPEMLDEWLNVLPEEVPVIIIIEACYSGNFITKMEGGKPVLSRLGRTIITSANEHEKAKLMPNKSSFSKYFFNQVEKNQDILTAFFDACETMSNIPYHSFQAPKLDANGNGIPNEQIDYALLGGSDVRRKVYIPDDVESAGEPPEIRVVTCVPNTLMFGETKATIHAKVSGLNIISVTANIISPNYEVAPKGYWEAIYNELELLDSDGDGIYQAEYDKFTMPGDYTIVVYASNSEGDAMSKVAVLTVEGKGTCSSDVNGDGEVDILDLVLVGRHFGEEGENIEGDVNGDGKVDINDLILVGKHFGRIHANTVPGKIIMLRNSQSL